MASIIKRKNKYAVVYWYEDDKGEKRQRWESFNTNAEAKKRKTEIEYQQETGELVIPEAKTISELLDEYMSIYGINTWAMSTYEARRSLISNYIKPIIGDMLIEDVTPRVIEKYYQSLLKVKSVCVNNRKPNNEYLSPHVVREVHKLLRCAFNQAVKWEMTKRNPCLNATLPKEDHKPRNIWDADTLFKAIDLCDDDMLKLAIKSVAIIGCPKINCTVSDFSGSSSSNNECCVCFSICLTIIAKRRHAVLKNGVLVIVV